MEEKIKNMLKKVLPLLIANPKIMEGYDLASEEVDYILKNKKFPFEWLKEVAWDNFFECCYDEINITYKEALKLRAYLINTARREIDELKREFFEIE